MFISLFTSALAGEPGGQPPVVESTAPAVAATPAEAPPEAPAAATTTSGPPMATLSEITTIRVGRPKFPQAALLQGLTDAKCIVRITAGADGVPLQAQPVTCPELFVEASVQAALESRIKPFTVDGKPSAVVFDFTFKYVSK